MCATANATRKASTIAVDVKSDAVDSDWTGGSREHAMPAVLPPTAAVTKDQELLTDIEGRRRSDPPKPTHHPLCDHNIF